MEYAVNESGSDIENESEKDYNKDPKRKATRKDVTSHGAMENIVADYNGILAFPQAVAVKAPRVVAAPLSLTVDDISRKLF